MSLQRTFTTLLAGALLSAAVPAGAHPGVGIVMDRRGNVFYTDLTQVWRIAPDGSRSVAVAGVHTHELHIDAADVLYGEHLWYEGERTDTWGHRVWQRTPNGAVSEIIPARAGFLTNYGYSFVRDAAGAMYWVEREHGNLFRKRAANGVVSDVARCADCRDVRWMMVTAGGTIYFEDLYDLRAIGLDGRVRLVVKRLATRTILQVVSDDRHALMGLWSDAGGNIYVADAAGRRVARVSPDGQVTTVASSPRGWMPTGGLVSDTGDLWVLEYRVTGAARVRRISPSGRVRVFQ